MQLCVKKFDVALTAPAPTLLYSEASFLKQSNLHKSGGYFFSVADPHHFYAAPASGKNKTFFNTRFYLYLTEQLSVIVHCTTTVMLISSNIKKN
jgi:hypothetical protein